MLPTVSKEVCDVVTMQLDNDFMQYVTTVSSKLKKEQPHLYKFLIENANQSISELKELRGEELHAFVIMCIAGFPFIVYEMLRNQEEAQELNSVWK